MSDDAAALSRRSFLQAGGAVVAASGLSSLPTTVAGAAAASSTSLHGANVSLIADALRDIGLNPMKLSMDTAIKPHVTGPETIIGSAMTTKWEIGRGRMSREDVQEYIYRPLDAAAPGTMWVVASGTDRILSLFGDIIAQASKRRGMAGAVTDNGFRDLARIRELGFPVFAKATVPHGPADIIRPVGANVPVVCGGVEVQPGDLIAADLDGVIVVPQESIAKLKVAVAAKLKDEQQQRDRIEAGAGLADTH